MTSQPVKDFCFCTLALGGKYRSLATLLARDLEKYSPKTPLVILTDKPEEFNIYPNVLAFWHQQSSVGTYHDKRFVIAKAISLFNACIFVDSNVRILDQVPDGLEWPPGITAKTGCSILTQNRKRDKFLNLVKKIATKLDLNLEDVKFVNEFMFVVTRDSGIEDDFIKQWGMIANYFELNGVYHGEGNAIGLAAAKVGFSVRFDSLKEISFFKDRIETMRIKRGQADQSEKLVFFEKQKQIEYPRQHFLQKLLSKLDKYRRRYYHLWRLRIVSLISDYDFYFR
ncbi:MAG: hypothetical protein F6K58_10225 [Symploca sp. SIO2E9]|nr:hypothetical protein [Symploca sp. SIO2E9]